jgi:anti-sigma regulatory factor (Ser/Thr protein kinase)
MDVGLLPVWEVSGVIETEGECAEWTFPAEPDAVRTARHVVGDTLRGWGLDSSLCDVTVLLVSELVTNSLRYASGPIGVRLCRPDADSAVPSLLVEVSDPLPDAPTERSAEPDDEGGRGLRLVAVTARRWGTRRGRTGKTVWFELALPG